MDNRPENTRLAPLNVGGDALMTMLSGPARELASIVLRQVGDIVDGRVDPPERTQDPAISVLETVVDSISTGDSLNGVQKVVEQLIHNQVDRAQLVQSLMVTHNYSRLVRYTKARFQLENFLLDCADRGDLTPTEALVMHKIITSEMTSIQETIDRGSSSINDVVSLVNKADYALQLKEQEVKKRFEKISPHQRELMRKFLYRTKKIMTAQSTTTREE